ncbi:MAG: ATP-binding protein [Candidatus Margulisiibacteriota bacterium]
MNFYNGSLLFTSVTSAALGLFVFSQDRRKMPNIILALLSAAIGAWCFGQFMGAVNSVKGVVMFWTRANIAAAIFIPVFYFHFVLVFLKRSKEYRTALFLAYAGAAVLLLLDLTPWFVADIAPRPGYLFYPVAGIVYPIFALYLVTLFLAAFVLQIVFLQNSGGAAANQTKYVLVASIVGLVGGLTAFFPVYNINLPVVSQFALPAYLAIIVYAIVKHQLLDINVVIRAGLVYSVLTFFFAGFYSLTIILTSRLFQNLTSFSEFSATVMVVFVSVLVFQPLRDRIQAAVDHLFFRGSYYYEKTINDLSAENLKLYQSLLQSEKLAALGTMAAGLAHEIKNPLASIKGMTQILPENLNDREFMGKYLDIIPRQLDRINSIIETLLRIGKPKKFVLSNVNLSKIIDDLLKLVEGQCKKKNIRVSASVPEDLIVRGDAEQLMQALMNLVLNAIDAMPQGGELKVAANEYNVNEGKRLSIEISDTGVGIAPENIKRVFDPFFSTKDNGTGLGMAITYRIIKEHNGDIEVESEERRGTKFKVWLSTKQKG